MVESIWKPGIKPNGWRAEIEQAVDRAKKVTRQTKVDNWFRKQWYRCLVVRLKREHQLAKEMRQMVQ
ncbi:hypothetical protein ACFL6U_25400 [Planctomycetota bacterium]